MGGQACPTEQIEGGSLALKAAKSSESSIDWIIIKKDQIWIDKEVKYQEKHSQCQEGRFDESIEKKTQKIRS